MSMMSRGKRIVKEKASHKIDAIIALVMATHAASSEGEKPMPGVFFVNGRRSIDLTQQDIERRRALKKSRFQKWIMGE